MLIAFTIAAMATLALLAFFAAMTATASEPPRVPERVVELDTHQALAQLNSEKEFEANLLDAVRKIEPSALDVYYSTDLKGNKLIGVAKELPNGQIETVDYPVSELSRWIEEGKAQEAAGPQQGEAQAQQGGSSGAMTGALLGFLAAQMMSSSSSPAAATGLHSSRQDFSATRNAAVSRYTSRLAPALGAVNRSGGNFTGSSSRGSFSSGGARSGGYASGG